MLWLDLSHTHSESYHPRYQASQTWHDAPTCVITQLQPHSKWTTPATLGIQQAHHVRHNTIVRIKRRIVQTLEQNPHKVWLLAQQLLHHDTLVAPWQRQQFECFQRHHNHLRTSAVCAYRCHQTLHHRRFRQGSPGKHSQKSWHDVMWHIGMICVMSLDLAL